MSSSLLFRYYNCCFYFFRFSLATRRFKLLAMRFSSTVSFPYYYYHGWMTIHISIAYYYIILQCFFALFLLIYKRKVQWHVSVFLVVNTSFFLTAGLREKEGERTSTFVYFLAFHLVAAGLAGVTGIYVYHERIA